MALYYKWIHQASPDLHEAILRNKLQYSQYVGGRYVASRKCIWVFQFGDDQYSPADSIWSTGVLVRITVQDDAARTIIENPEYWIDFENMEVFRGEAAHGNKIIIKNNEPGARGIGQLLLDGQLSGQITDISQASRQEYARSLGVPARRVQWRKWQP